MTSRVIALDLDGTLLTPKKTLLPSSIEALTRAKAAGHQLLIVTGRIMLPSTLFIRHWRWIHLQFVVMALICMIIMQKKYSLPIHCRCRKRNN